MLDSMTLDFDSEIEEIERLSEKNEEHDLEQDRYAVDSVDDSEDDDDDDDEVICDFDDILYCDTCLSEWEGDCPKHGPLLIVRDTPIMKHGRARWRVDATEPGLSNWMRYVRRASWDDEHNLMAFQYFGKIYYRTVRPVVPMEELVVCYTDQFGRPSSDTVAVCTDRNCRKTKVTCPVDCPYVCDGQLHEGDCCQHSQADTCDETEISSNAEERVQNEVSTTNHTEKHSREKRYECRHCKKQFLLAIALKVHERKHAADKPTCDVCNRQFSRKCNLARHLSVHKTANRFMCTLCDKTYLERHFFTAHLLAHRRDNKGLVCVVCSRRFRLASHLSNHLRQTHVKEEPFDCIVCDDKFAKGRHLIAHLIDHGARRIRYPW